MKVCERVVLRAEVRGVLRVIYKGPLKMNKVALIIGAGPGISLVIPLPLLGKPLK